jgi:hypothetical protein
LSRLKCDEMSHGITERTMLDLLRARYGISGGNGPRYAFAEQVRSTVGHDAPRTADFIAMRLWALRQRGAARS